MRSVAKWFVWLAPKVTLAWIVGYLVTLFAMSIGTAALETLQAVLGR